MIQFLEDDPFPLGPDLCLGGKLAVSVQRGSFPLIELTTIPGIFLGTSTRQSTNRALGKSLGCV